MAKKSNFSSSKMDEGNYDDLDLPDFDLDMGSSDKIGKSRKPIANILKDVRKGIGKSVFDRSNIKKAIRKALPEGYGQALDFKDEAVSTAKDLYDKAAKEVKPNLKELLKATNKLVPESNRRTKDALRQIDKFFADRDSDYGYSGEDKGSEADHAIASSMGEMFKFQMKRQAKLEEDKDNKDRIKDGLDSIRSRQQLSMLNNISLNTARLAQYQDKVTIAWQKKSLEVQYRSYFLLADTLKETKASNENMKVAMEAVVKNTGLPDFVKLQNSELYAQLLKNKFANAITDKLFGTNSMVMKKVKDNLSRTLQGYTQTVGNALMTFTDMANQTAMEKELGMSSSMGEMAGEIGGAWGLEKGMGKIKGYIDKKDPTGKHRAKIRRVGHQASYGTRNSMNLGKDWAQKNMAAGGAKGFLASFVMDMFAGTGNDTKLADKSNPREPHIFNNANSRSLNEVIPGFLARIYRELQVMRTGDDKIGLTKFDLGKGTFISAKQSKELIQEKLSGKTKAEQLSHSAQRLKEMGSKTALGKMVTKSAPSQINTTDAILALIDPTGKKIPAKLRNELKKTLLMDRMNGKLGNLDRYGNADNFSGMTDKEAAKIAKAFRDHGGIKGTDQYIERNNNFNTGFNNLGREVEDKREIVQDLVDQGFLDHLIEMGIVAEDGEIQMDKLVDMQMNPGSLATPAKRAASRAGTKTGTLTGAKKPRMKSMAAKIEKPKAKVFRMDVPVKRSAALRGQPSQAYHGTAGGVQEVRAAGVEEILKRIEQLILHKDFGAGAGLGAQGKAPTAAYNALLNAKESAVSQGKKIASAVQSHKYAGVLGAKGHEWYSKAKAAGKGVVGMARGLVNMGLSTTVPTFKGLLAGARTGGETAANYLKDRYKSLHVWGEKNERLQAAKLRAGRYYDEGSKKIIETWGDIKGAVRDLDTNEIVLKADELKNTFMKSGIVGKTVEVGTKLGAQLIKTSQSLNSRGMEALRFGKEAAKGVFGRVMDHLDGPMDVYIKGEEEPVLKKDDMAAGKYIDVLTKKVIEKPTDITGPVRQGRKWLITTADFKTGLVDEYGHPLRGLAGRIGQRLGAGAIKMWNKGKNAVKGAYNAFTKMMGNAGGVVAGVLEGVGNAFGLNEWGKRNTTLLQQIYDLLDERMPKDANLREGSWQKDQKDGDFAGGKRKNSEPAAGPAKAGRKNVIDAGMEKLKSMKDGVMDLLGMGGKDDDDTAVGKDGKKINKGKKGGKLRRMGNIAKGALASGAGMFKAGAVGLGVGWGVDKLSSAVGGPEWLGGAAGLAATGYSLAGGSLLGAASAIGSGAWAVGSVVASAGAAIVAAVGWPVILGAMAVAGAAYGAHALYKHLTKPTKLQIYRAAQYGFFADQEDEVSAVMEMESTMSANVKFEDGKAVVDEKKIDIDKLCKLFGFQPEDEKAKNSWMYWMQKRFKPVFLTHMTALNNVKSGTTLANVDKLSAAERLKYLAQTVMDSATYGDFTSPFPKLPHLRAGPKAVQAAYNVVKKEWDEDAAKEGDKKGVTLETSGYLKGAAGTLVGKAGADQAKEKGAKLSMSQRVDNAFKGFMKDLVGVWNTVTSPFVTAVKDTVNAITWVGDKISKTFGGNIEAMEGVRFRAYGLKDMDRMKVMALRDLETEMSKGIVLDAGGQVQWIGDANAIYDKIGGQFGIGSNKDSMETFANWLTKRFLPAYSKYRGELARYTGKVKQADAEKALKPEDAIAVAQAVAGAPVWNVSASPWSGYQLNTDAASVQPNIEFLKGKAKDLKLTEQKKQDAGTSSSSSANTAKPVTDPGKSNIAKAYATTNAQAPADGEDASAGKGNGGGTAGTSAVAGNVVRAGGEMRDGSAASQYINARGADLNNINPEMRKLFFGMVQEYGETTGKKVGVNSGFRSMEDQAAAYKKDPSKAAPPGSSMHEFGLALDVDSATLNEMEKMGLMRKYGFTRPVGKEPWHTEPAGIQLDYMNLRKDPSQASAAVLNGVGKGGGGWGTDRSAQFVGRNPSMAKYLLNKADDPSAVGDQSAQAGSPGVPTAAAAGTPGSTVATRGWRPGNPVTTPGAGSPIGGGGGQGGAAGSPGMGGGSSVTSALGSPGASNDGSIGSAATNDNTPTATPGAAGAYAKISDPKGPKGWAAMKDMLIGAAKAIGIPVNTLLGLIGVESNFDPNARAGSSTAGGLGQFLAGTWREMMAKHANRLGIPGNATQFDAKASALMTAQYVKDNGGTNVSATRAYMAHFLGPGGAKKFFAARPDAVAASILPDAAKSNPGIFYDNGRPRTVAQVYALLQSRLNDKLSRAGADASMLDRSSFAANDPKGAAATGAGSSPDLTASGPNLGGASPAAALPAAAPKGRPNDLSSYDMAGSADSQGFKAPNATTSSPSASNAVMGPGTPNGQPIQNPQGDLVKGLGNLEGIMSEQLTVQKQMLAIMQGMMNGKQAEEASKAAGSGAASRQSTSSPELPVPMTRQRTTV